MKKELIFILAIVAIFFGKLNGEEEFEEEEPNVYKVTDSNFEEIIKKFPYLFVKFYAPWCGHCKSLAPEFSKAAKELQDKGVNVAFGNIDATIQQQLAAKFEIRGYPTVKMFIDGVPVEYESGRQSQDIIAWVENKINKKSEEINSVEELEKMKDAKKALLVYFGEKNSEFTLFERLAKQFDDVDFAHTFSEEIKTHFIGSKIVLFKQFDEKRNDYLEEFDIAKIYEFIAMHSVPTILEFEQKAAQLIFGELKPAMALFLDNEQHQKAYQEFEIASKELKDKLVLTKSVINEGLGQRFAEYMGVTAEQLPSLFIVKVVGQDLQKFKLEKEITSENLIAFYNDFAEGKITQTRKSEEIPESNEGPVIKVVGKQFEQIVLDNTKDVLVKYFAPWCGHCKQMAPTYEKVAEILKSNPNIILAEYDATANENEQVSIQGFPTIIFYPSKNKKESINFEGSRTEEGIIDFIKEHATVDWIEPKETEQKTEEKEEIKSEL